MVKILIVLLFSLSAFGRSSDDNLTRLQAQRRKAQVKKVDYKLLIELNKGSESFSGKTTIDIELNHLRDDLTIDANLEKIQSISINDKALTNFPQRAGSFDIPQKSLQIKMRIEITYQSRASFESRGIRKIKDAVDGEEYYFTDFEPYYAHWMFPCLDQPDLKATYELTVKAPAEWKIIHNEMINSENLEKDKKITAFKKTPQFSTYSFFLGAGPYAEWTDKQGDIPLFIHARKSISKFVDSEKLFQTIKQGLKFFADYYDFPYPYSKYGQVFVPDLAINAVESAGAVTFHELYIFVSPPSISRLNARDNIILHEIAHMWFGNLVTMKWWNDLWLKEGFATYSAAFAQERGLKSEYGALEMLNAKTWGYWQDLTQTSHPIESDIPDVRASKGIFDGITYAKGAAAIKQLHFYVGEEGFQKGIRSYFKRYALKNADREEFIQSIAQASGKELKEWSYKWLQTFGPNKIRLEYLCTKNKLSEVTITQEKSSSGNLSPHRILFGLYKPSKEGLTLLHTIDVGIENDKRTLTEFNNVDCPQFILPNLKDEDYAIYVLDKTSLKNASMAMTKLPDPLSRLQVWFILMQMVRDQELSPVQFMDLAKEAIKFERDENILGFIFARNTQIRDFRQIYYQFLTVKQRAGYALDFEKIFWQNLQMSKPRSSLQSMFFDSYTAFAQSKESQVRLYEMVHNKNLPEGIKIDPERRWRIFRALASNGHPEVMRLIENERKFDPSMLAKAMGIGAIASFPDPKIKQDVFNKIFIPGALSYNELFQASQSFHSPNHPELMQSFVEPYFKELTKLDWKKLDDFVKIAFMMFPGGQCSKDVEQMSSRYLKSAKNLSTLAEKAWKESHGELERCVKTRSSFR